MSWLFCLSLCLAFAFQGTLGTSTGALNPQASSKRDSISGLKFETEVCSDERCICRPSSLDKFISMNLKSVLNPCFFDDELFFIGVLICYSAAFGLS